MTLAFAQRCADRIADWLGPYCDRLEIAGSIRRCRHHPNDVDIVAIPKVETGRDLFGKELAPRNLAAEAVHARATAERWVVDGSGDACITVYHACVQVDLFWATQDTWGTVLLCRTGSKEHNIWLAELAKGAGGKWHPHRGLYLRGKIYAATEDEIYAALGLDPIPPSRREDGQLPHVPSWGRNER